MDDVEHKIVLLQVDIDKANAAIAKAVRDRRALNKDSPLVNDFTAAIATARQALSDLEIKLRALYESKDE